jgi:hypothetical protein
MQIDCPAQAVTFREVPQGGFCALAEAGRTFVGIKIIQQDYSGRPFSSCAVIWPSSPDPASPSWLVPGDTLETRSVLYWPDAILHPDMAAVAIAPADGIALQAGMLVLCQGKLFVAVPGIRGAVNLVDVQDGEVALRLPAAAGVTFDAWKVSVPGADGRETICRWPLPTA